MCSERQWISMFGKWSIDQGGCSTKWNKCIRQDIDTSCRYDNDPRWFPKAMDVTESHLIVLIKFSQLAIMATRKQAKENMCIAI